jgi:hypothetical protein
MIEREVVAEGHIVDSGIMSECVTNRISFVPAGSLREDGTLGETITDRNAAQAPGVVTDVSLFLHPLAKRL